MIENIDLTQELINLGVDENILNDVINLFNQKLDFFKNSMVHKSLLDDANNTIDKLKNDIILLQNSNLIDNAILKAGGRNVKAIKALFDDEFINSLFNTKLNHNDILNKINDAIDEIKISEPYLFNVSKTKKRGTGLSQNSTTTYNSFDDIITNSARAAAGLK